MLFFSLFLQVFQQKWTIYSYFFSSQLHSNIKIAYFSVSITPSHKMRHTQPFQFYDLPSSYSSIELQLLNPAGMYCLERWEGADRGWEGVGGRMGGGCLFYFLLDILFGKPTEMWKAIGSVHSGDDKSVRSNRSREEVRFEPFHRNQQNRTADLQNQRERSFCYDYLQKKREDFRNMTYNSRAKSEKSLRLDKEDMFTSMRNILGKDEVLDSNITPKANPPVVSERAGQQTAEKNERIIKQAVTRVSKLKKEQSLLKETLSSEFTTFKNMFYQIEEIMHTYADRTEEKASSQPTATDVDPDFIKDIVQEAMSIEKYFAEMDRKKSEIMARLTHQ